MNAQGGLQIIPRDTAGAAQAPADQPWVYLPPTLAGELAASWVHMIPNQFVPPDNDRAGAYLLNASAITSEIGGGPALVAPETPPTRGSQAEAIWEAMVKSIQNRLPGRP